MRGGLEVVTPPPDQGRGVPGLRGDELAVGGLGEGSQARRGQGGLAQPGHVVEQARFRDAQVGGGRSPRGGGQDLTGL